MANGNEEEGAPNGNQEEGTPQGNEGKTALNENNEAPPNGNGGGEGGKPTSRIDKFFSTDWTGYIKIALALGLVLFITLLFAQWFSTWRGNRLTEKFVLEPKQSVCPDSIGDETKRNFINAQRTEIVGYATSHKNASIEFYAYFYATYLIFALFSIFAGIALAVITKEGIELADNRVIAVFLISTGIVVLSQGFFSVFKQPENGDINAKLYVSYARLVNQIDTYCITGKLNVKDPIQQVTIVNPTSATTPAPTPALTIKPFSVALSADEFINYIDWRIEEYKSLPIVSVDAAKIAAIDNQQFALP